ncbi:DNA mismatch repair protein MutS [soil metagenome]
MPTDVTPGAPTAMQVDHPSVLRPPGSSAPDERAAQPAYFADLHLDQVVAAITKGREPYDLEASFHVPLRDPDCIAYRHEVFHDLDDADLRDDVEAFAETMRRRRMFARRATAARNPLRSQRLVLDAASTYCHAITALERALARTGVRSRGLRSVAAYVAAYARAPAFDTLRADVERLERQLDSITYRLTLHDDRIRVRKASAQHDYGEEIERTFRKFARRSGAARTLDDGDRFDMNHVEAAILAMVARLHGETFDALAAFASRHAEYVDPMVERFEHEVQFYLAYIAHVRRFESLGLHFCLPSVSTADGQISAEGVFDLALAATIQREGGEIVTNDFRLSAAERLFVITGANQGGKSTFARTFGQLHHLAALGCPVPGRTATLALFDDLLTHFEREEDLRTLQGKLQEELTRLHGLLERATPRSIVIMNESFSSTATADAAELGRATLRRLLEIGVIGVYVTFIEELSTLDERIVSLTATVDPIDPTRRTFEIVRRRADGRAHALAIARTYGLTYEELRRRLGA